MARSKTAKRKPANIDAPGWSVSATVSDKVAPALEWNSTLHKLIEGVSVQNPVPSWWSDGLSFYAMAETLPAQSEYSWDGMKRPCAPPFALFQFTLAGWGSYQQGEDASQVIGPGVGFVALIPSKHHYFLPKDSPGWTFGWVAIYHPYLLSRIAKQVSAAGPIVHFEPASGVFACALRIISGCQRKDFRDPFEVELALFEFVIAYERLVYQSRHPTVESRLLESVRTRVLSNLKVPPSVEQLAEECRMTRTHFSHYFREQTGQTPGHFVAQVRIEEATRMLLSRRSSLKQISETCGFANVNHFIRVFGRFHKISPGAYRRLIP